MGGFGIILQRKNKWFDYLELDSSWCKTGLLYCAKLYLMSPAVRGLWPAQVAMVVTMTTMENMREMPRRGCERINGQDQGLPRVSGFQWSYRQGFKTMLEDLPSTFHYLH